MCSMCLTVPCHPRCPNAKEAKSVYDCECCSEGIIPGEEYAEINGVKYHIDCLEDMPVRELLQLFGVDTYTAEED